MLSFRKFIEELEEEAVAANCAGGGAIAGIGVGPQGEPGFKNKKKKRGGADAKEPGRKVLGSLGFRT